MKKIQTTSLLEVAKIVEAHGLTMEEFKTYQRMMPEKRKLIHEATLKIYETLPINENQLSKLLGINRDKMNRMKVGGDVDQLPAHHSPDEVEILRKMILEGNGYDEISSVIGRSRNSAMAMASKYELTMKKLNPELYARCHAANWATKRAQ